MRVPSTVLLRPVLFASALMAGAGPALAQDSQAAPRTIRATPLGDGEELVLDGVLDEPAWQRAAASAGFLQRDPDNGAPVSERTEVRILFDRFTLYLGFSCFDSEPDRLLGNQMQRDQPFEADDRLMWAIDTFLDGRTGYFFEVNPSGAMGDGLVRPGLGGNVGGEVNKSWDGIWLARVRRTDEGWFAEIEIPFRTVNFARGADAWGINFQRTVRRKNEEALWTGHARNQGLTRLSNAGRLEGLSNISQGLGLDIVPYAVANAESAPGRGRPATTGDGAVGVDLFYNVTPGLRFNFTVNTDFAETEVDERRVNLTRFPLFFPEKRDFFLEGSSFFDFSSEPGSAVVPFFSRRIGLDPTGNPQRINYGAKLTGQAGQYDVGVLHVRTGEEEDLQLAGEDFTVLRMRRRFLARSFVGAIYTRRAGDETLPDRHKAGVDFELATSTFRGSQNLELSGFFLHTTNLFDDGGSDGYALRLSYPNDPWSARISVRELQEHYDPAVGFVERRNYRRVNPVANYTRRPSDHAFIRSVTVGFNSDFTFDLDNVLVTRTHNITVMDVEFHSGDTVFVNVEPDYELLQEDFEIVPGVVLPAGEAYDFVRYAIELNSASRRKLALTARAELGTFYSGNRQEYVAGLTLRPRPGWLLTLEAGHNEVDLVEGRFTTDLVRGVVNTQFSPWMSVANNLQYDTVSRILGWQLRYRWITSPGNDIYFVYTHNWRDEDNFQTLDRRAAAKVIRTYRF
jgi:hypothetical protein